MTTCRYMVWSRRWFPRSEEVKVKSEIGSPRSAEPVATLIPGHVKWPRTQVHYVQVSVGGYSLISYAYQIDVEARTSNSAALFSVV